MTLKEFGENLKNLNEVFEQLRKKYQKPGIGKPIEVAEDTESLMIIATTGNPVI